MHVSYSVERQRGLTFDLFFFFLPTLLPSRTVLTLYSLILGLHLPLVEEKAITHAWNTDVRGCRSSLFVISGGLRWAGFPNVRQLHTSLKNILEQRKTWKTRAKPKKIQLLGFHFYLFIFGWTGSSLPWQAFSSCNEWGLLFVAVSWTLVAVAFLVAEHRPSAHRFRELQHVGSVVVAHGLSSSVACGTFPD